ncbi:PucR family transcriptional regulator [Parvimonas micra]
MNIDYIFYDYFLDKKYYNKVFLKNENNFSKSIFSKNKEIGKLILNIPKIELSEFDKTIIDYALEIALIQIEKEITIVKLKENYLNDFISDILSGNIQSKEELLIRAKLFDIDIDGYSSVIIFDIDNYKYSIVQKPLENIKLEEIKRKMFEKIIQNFELLKSKVLYYKKSDSLVLITKHNSSDNTLLNELEFLVSKLKKIIKSDFNFTFTVGMGNIQKDIMDINKSYEEALDCIKIGRLLEENDGIFKYDDIEFFKILSTTINSSKTPSFINDILKILKYDKEKDTTYFETLNRLIENNWSLKQTSKKQFLHYNTIKYRFEKISEIINKDLNDNNTRFLLELGYRYLKLNKNILE